MSRPPEGAPSSGTSLPGPPVAQSVPKETTEDEGFLSNPNSPDKLTRKPANSFKVASSIKPSLSSDLRYGNLDSVSAAPLEEQKSGYASSSSNDSATDEEKVVKKQGAHPK